MSVLVGMGTPWGLGYPLPGHTNPLDTSSPWTYSPSRHTHPLLVTHGGHHWRHTHSPAPHGWVGRQTDTCENIVFPQLRLRAVKYIRSGSWIHLLVLSLLMLLRSTSTSLENNTSDICLRTIDLGSNGSVISQ